MTNFLQQWLLTNILWVVVAGFVVYTCMIVEFIFITRNTGNLRRGICVSRQRLPREYIYSLQGLQNKTREGKWVVLRQRQELLFTRRDFSRLWYLWYFPYVGYLDLEKEDIVLEYRTPFSNIVTWTVLASSCVIGVIIVSRGVALPLSQIHYIGLGVFGVVVCFNVVLFFAAHKEEIWKLRTTVDRLAKKNVAVR
jgi:hypothetical protein